jgi:hypothetical protein
MSKDYFTPKVLFLVLLVAVIFGCVSSSVTPIGNHVLRPLPTNAPVEVYIDEKDAPKPFEAVAVVSYTNPGKYQVLSLGDAIPALKVLARKAGANGIIILNYRTIKSGFISTGLGIEAKAIIIPTNHQ